MNYGYVDLGQSAENIPVGNKAMQDRSMELYRQVVLSVDLSGLSLLEIGCGRGGGTDFLQKHFPLRGIIGIDLSSEAIRFCRRAHFSTKLHFFAADAQHLSFRSESFDAVLNVESSHCYPDEGRFLNEVKRVLRVGGYFLIADFRPLNQLASLRSAITTAGFKVIEEENITANVLRAMEIDSPQKSENIREVVPESLHAVFREFTGVEGSSSFTAFRDGRSMYFRYVLRKES